MKVGDLVRYSYTLPVPTLRNQKFEMLGMVMREVRAEAGISVGQHAFILLNGQDNPTWIKLKHLEVVSHASR